MDRDVENMSDNIAYFKNGRAGKSGNMEAEVMFLRPEFLNL